MEPSLFRKNWLDLRRRKVAPKDLSQLSRQISGSFMDYYRDTGLYEGEYVRLLCEMATSFSDPELNNIASASLFEVIVEELCDDFEDLTLDIYNLAMAEVISYCRKTPAGVELDRQIADFGIRSFDELHRRANLVRTRQYNYDINKPLKRIILLSRVTIGADVAILSVIVQRLTRIFPGAEVVIFGSRKLRGIFGGNPCLRIVELSYPRRGGLFDRFSAWHQALGILAEEMPAHDQDNTLLIDPDSRISQLGVLPLTQPENYLFFNSQNNHPSSKCTRMAELANRWVDDVFGVSDFCYPKVWIPAPIRSQGQKMIACLRASGCERTVAVNFGIGQNPRKRVGMDFEVRLVQTVVILDRGYGKDEFCWSAELLSRIQNQGFQTASANFRESEYPKISHGVIAIECTIGEMAALIGQSDEFVGYDSACQHISAAAGTPTLTVFAGANNAKFIRRWSACGDTPCRTVHVDTVTDPQHINISEVVSRIMQERILMTSKRPTPKYREIQTTQRVGHTRKKALSNDVQPA